jgi:CubicO group peptidase (beta-lactamase class C family)
MSSSSALGDLAAYAQAQKTTGLLLIAEKRAVLERNWPFVGDGSALSASLVRGVASDGALLEDVASQQKSFLSVLAAIAIERGLLDIERSASDFHGECWSRAAPELERQITVRHLLEMTSGLDEQLAFAAPAGTQFFYNTPAYARLHAVVEKSAGLPLDALTAQWLTCPLGMADSGWRPRGAELARISGNAWSFVTSPRDVAKFGQRILDGGIAQDGTRLLSKEAIAAMLAPTETNPAYARLWWRNDSAWSIDVAGVRTEDALLPHAPRDTILALGAAGRILAVIPSHAALVVRLGQQPPDPNFRTEFWRRVTAALQSP